MISLDNRINLNHKYNNQIQKECLSTLKNKKYQCKSLNNHFKIKF